jgi:hypothetical protein
MWFFRQTSPIIVLVTLIVSFAWYIAPWGWLLGTVVGYNVYIGDLLFGLTFIYCIVGALRRWRYSPLELLVLGLGGLHIVNFGRGLAGPSAATAGNAFREFAIFAVIFVFMYFWGRGLNRDWLFDKIVLLGWGTVLLSFTRLILGDAFIFLESDPFCEYCEPRTLSGAAALMLGQALLIAFNEAVSLSSGAKRWRRGASSFIFAAALLISRERTATLATLGGLALIVVSLPRKYRNAAIGAGSIAVLAATVLLWTVWVESRGGDIIDYLPRAISWTVNEEGTYGWRVKQWERYLELYWAGPIIDQIIGQPLGARDRAAAESNDPDFLVVGPHSEYVELLLNSGVVGVLLFTSVLILAVVKGAFFLMHTGDVDVRSKARWAVAVLFSFMIFSYTYSLPVEQGLLLAVALQVIALHSSTSDESRPTSFRRHRQRHMTGAHLLGTAQRASIAVDVRAS